MILKALMAALLATLLFGVVQTLSLAQEKNLRVAAEIRNTSLTLLLKGCRARAINLTEDKESDNAVDNLTDNELRVVPNRWLRGGTAD